MTEYTLITRDWQADSNFSAETFQKVLLSGVGYLAPLKHLDRTWQDLLAKQMYPCEQQGPKCVPLALYLKLLKSS
jgi:hypothetical protein